MQFLHCITLPTLRMSLTSLFSSSLSLSLLLLSLSFFPRPVFKRGKELPELFPLVLKRVMIKGGLPGL